jgi:hypothetical protein
MPEILSKQFHHQTDFNFELGSLPSDPQYWPKEWKEIYHKSYPRLPKISLEENYLNLGRLEDAILNRTSKREYDLGKKITLPELSTILHYSVGTKKNHQDENLVRRFYPSGGARYPLEVYMAILRVDGVAPGIYHFNVKENELELLSSGRNDIDLLMEGLYYPWSREAAVVFLISAAWDRNFIKYKVKFPHFFRHQPCLLNCNSLSPNLQILAAAS